MRWAVVTNRSSLEFGRHISASKKNAIGKMSWMKRLLQRMKRMHSPMNRNLGKSIRKNFG
jgi:hypothetical protein